VLAREDAGANLICHEGGIGHLTSMLKETEEAVIVGAIRVLACLSKNSQKRVSDAQQSVCLSPLSFTHPRICPPFCLTVSVSEQDVSLPEVRSTALAIQYFIESAGAALAPLLAGIIAVKLSLHQAILGICLVAWLICGGFLAGAAYTVPVDIRALRKELSLRAEREKARLSAGA